MRLIIFGDSISGNCLKVKWTAQHLGLPFEWRETSVIAGDTRTEAFRRVNPDGQVPAVILADGRSLAQSNAIIVHLAEGSALIPSDAYNRARMFEWLFWEQYSHEPAIAVARFQMRFLGKARDAMETGLFTRGEAALDRLEAALTSRPFLVGGALSLADVALVAYTRWAPEGGFDLGRFAAVKAWIARVERDLPITD